MCSFDITYFAGVAGVYFHDFTTVFRAVRRRPTVMGTVRVPSIIIGLHTKAAKKENSGAAVYTKLFITVSLSGFPRCCVREPGYKNQKTTVGIVYILSFV